MGRHGPLTSMALGRSPYDDIVMGEGEGDPRAPLQMYDERGRPVNPETRRINRDVIRSHNEVMLVIGVVEAENSIDEVRAERARHIAHLQHDTRLARRFEWASRACELAGVWGVAGLRSRILLYREYAHVPVSRLIQHELQARSLRQLFWDGLPAFVVANAMELPYFGQRIMSSTALKWGFTYVQAMLKIWIFLSRTSLLPASSSSWFPHWKYFIPFTTSSFIPPCPPPSTLTSRSVISWLGSVALSVAPIMGLWFSEGLIDWMREFFYEVIYELLPNPSGPELPPIPANLIVQRASTNPDDPIQSQTQSGPVPLSNTVEAVPVRVGPAESEGTTPGDGNVWEVPQTTETPAQPEADADPGTGEGSQSPPPPRNNGAGRPDTRRRPSHRPQAPQNADADDFTDDDEDANEIVSATLISFDVENNPENPDPNDANIPPGVWSAELRPNPGNESQGGGGGAAGDRDGEDRPRRPLRLYRDNALTRLPATLAADMLARRAASLLLAPMEAMVLRNIAEWWCRPRGLSTAAIWGFSRGTVLNLLGVEIVHFLLDADMWASISMVSNEFVVSSAEWEKMQKEEQERGLGFMTALENYWTRPLTSLLPALLNSRDRALRLLYWQGAPDEQGGPAEESTRQFWPGPAPFWELFTSVGSGEHNLSEFPQEMAARYPELQDRIALRDAMRVWRAEETVPWKQHLLDGFIAELGRPHSRAGIFSGVREPGPRDIGGIEDGFPVEMEIDG